MSVLKKNVNSISCIVFSRLSNVCLGVYVYVFSEEVTCLSQLFS